MRKLFLRQNRFSWLDFSSIWSLAISLDEHQKYFKWFVHRNSPAEERNMKLWHFEVDVVIALKPLLVKTVSIGANSLLHLSLHSWVENFLFIYFGFCKTLRWTRSEHKCNRSRFIYFSFKPFKEKKGNWEILWRRLPVKYDVMMFFKSPPDTSFTIIQASQP